MAPVKNEGQNEELTINTKNTNSEFNSNNNSILSSDTKKKCFFIINLLTSLSREGIRTYILTHLWIEYLSNYNCSDYINPILGKDNFISDFILLIEQFLGVVGMALLSLETAASIIVRPLLLKLIHSYNKLFSGKIYLQLLITQILFFPILHGLIPNLILNLNGITPKDKDNSLIGITKFKYYFLIACLIVAILAVFLAIFFKFFHCQSYRVTERYKSGIVREYTDTEIELGGDKVASKLNWNCFGFCMIFIQALVFLIYPLVFGFITYFYIIAYAENQFQWLYFTEFFLSYFYLYSSALYTKELAVI
jgi:hypothetical protein